MTVTITYGNQSMTVPREDIEGLMDCARMWAHYALQKPDIQADPATKKSFEDRKALALDIANMVEY